LAGSDLSPRKARLRGLPRRAPAGGDGPARGAPWRGPL